MKNRKKILFFIVLIVGIVGSILFFTNQKKELTIDEILKTDAYNYLSDNVKDFIKEHYEETGELYLTEKNFKGNEAYLNPSYIEYLDSNNKDSYNIIPSVTAYVPKLMAVNDNLPSSFDLRNVNGKNYVTPVKNQGNEGLCWAFATASLLETHDLIEKDKSYDSSAILFSEKQMDYALSKNGIIGGNYVIDANRNLTEGATLSDTSILLSERLGGFQDTWEEINSNVIASNQALEPSIVFNRSKSLYELDKTISINYINSTNSTVEERENAKKIIKNSIYNFGGALVNSSVTSSNTTKNIINKNDYLNVNIRDYVNVLQGNHALHIIGWDDNYEYSFCSYYWAENNYKYINSGTTDDNGNDICFVSGGKVESQKVSGKGVWILKNSWGTQYSYLYVPYDSELQEVIAFADYSEKTWDNSYTLEYSNLKYNNAGFSLKKDAYINNEIIQKIKMYSLGPIDFTLYYSEDGNENNYISLGEYSFEYRGINTIDLSSKNLNINNNSMFKINQSGTIYSAIVFTDNVNKNAFINTNNYVLSLENEKPSSSNYLNIDIRSNVKNIDDNSSLVYKIKNDNNEYLSDILYDVVYNKTYYNIATPIIKLKNEVVKIGNYSLETWYDDTLLTTSSLQFNIEFMSIDGSGTELDPWQIKNIRHFNMIRNAPYDNYILMNDLDFEYDTTNSNGLFYNNGSGWNNIPNFYGNFNGNGKTIKNIISKNGLFDSVTVSNGCRLSQCGIHDLQVNNIDILNLSSSIGGIINFINYENTYTGNFSNLSATNVKIHSSKSSAFGGIVGGISLYDVNDWSNTILKIDNWNSDVYFDNSSNQVSDYIGHHSGGLIGTINSSGTQAYLYISNAKTNVYYEFNDNEYYTISDIIGYISLSKSHLYLNNIIGVLGGNFDNSSNIESNAFVGYAYASGNGNITINGAKSTLLYEPNDKITISNYESNLKPYEIARSDYNSYKYYEDKYYVYNEQYDGTTKVSFEDKFNHKENTVPTLKQFPEEYAEYVKVITLNVGETKSIEDLITFNSNNKKVHIYSEFLCDLDICNNATDDTIITIPTLQNEYQFTGLNSGSTYLIIYDEKSGYLDAIKINVMGENDYHLAFDYNYDNIIDDTYVVTKGATYGNLPNISRNNYKFLGWFTERENGIKIEENTIFNGNSDVILYAHWQISNYIVTFNTDGGSSIANQTIDYNGKVIKPSNPTKTGYTFKEWQLNGNTYNFNNPVTSNITLTAVWTINQYTVAFNSNGGSSIANQTIDYNGKVTKPSNPTKEGYTFKEWQLNGNTYDFNTPVTENITLTAVWITNKYTVIFNSNGGSNVASQTIDYNGKAIKPSNPTREGYTFKYWSLNGEEYDFNTSVTSNITLVAEWEEVVEESLKDILEGNNYTVTNTFVSKFTLGDTITQIKNKLGNNITIETDKTIIATGAIIRKGTESYTVVIKGDLTGDGKVNSGDLLQMRKYLLEEVNLTGAYKEAGIIESIGNIKSLDLLRLRQYLLGDYTFN